MTPGLLIGAYERDNFGDLLFLLVTRGQLADVPSQATSFVAGDMTSLIGESIEPYADWLDHNRVPFLWVVGGETGLTSVEGAEYMSSADDPGNQQRNAAIPAFASPYLPRPSRYPATIAAKYVVNSVGVAGIRVLTGQRRIETLGALREATFLSVRDRDSGLVLARAGIDHRVAPDAVHTLLGTHTPSRAEERDVALVQAKARTIETIGPRAFAALLAESRQLRPYRVRLFSAGEARGHDSTPLLDDVATEMSALGMGARVEVSRAKSPLDKADEIASCGLWIGTSLHGYIISTAYSVPRVGLLRVKLKRYAESWGIPYPADSRLQQLDDAIEAAVAEARSGDPKRQAATLARLASENFRTAKAHIEEAPSPGLLQVRETSDRLITKRLGRVTTWNEATERQFNRAKRVALRSAAHLGFRGTKRELLDTTSDHQP